MKSASQFVVAVAMTSMVSFMMATASCPCAAAADDPLARQHADIAVQRQAVQRRFDEKARDCQQRFVVTACIDAAQKERREALTPLRQEDLRLDTFERKQRAAARLEEIEAKQRADAAREGSLIPRANAASQPEAGVQNRAVKPITGSRLATPLGDDERKRREAESLARYEANQAAGAQRREAADARKARREAAGKVVRPLPPPEGASSAP